MISDQKEIHPVNTCLKERESCLWLMQKNLNVFFRGLFRLFSHFFHSFCNCCQFHNIYRNVMVAATLFSDALASLALMVVTGWLTDWLIETGDWQFCMFDSSRTNPLVFYLVSLVSLVSLVALVCLVWSPWSVWSPWCVCSPPRSTSSSSTPRRTSGLGSPSPPSTTPTWTTVWPRLRPTMSTMDLTIRE